MANIGIFYGSTTGNTQGVAEKIQAGFGGREVADLCPISEASVDALDAYQYLVLGTSTWGIGELQDDWLDGINKLDRVDFSNKKVAVFGTGDPQAYPDSFVDAIGIIYEKLADRGATVVGFWPTEGYAYDASKAEKDGQFVGLIIDEDNQSDLTEGRVNKWIEDLKVVMQ